MGDIYNRKVFTSELGHKIKEIEDIQKKIESLESEKDDIKRNLSAGKKIDPDILKFVKTQSLKKLRMAECKNKAAKLQYELMKKNSEDVKMKILIKNYQNQQKILEKILNELSKVPKTRETVHEPSRQALSVDNFIQKDFKNKLNFDFEENEERRSIQRLLKENRKLQIELEKKIKEDEMSIQEEKSESEIIERLKNAENRVSYLENKMRYYNKVDDDFNLFDFTTLNDKYCPYC